MFAATLACVWTFRQPFLETTTCADPTLRLEIAIQEGLHADLVERAKVRLEQNRAIWEELELESLRTKERRVHAIIEGCRSPYIVAYEKALTVATRIHANAAKELHRILDHDTSNFMLNAQGFSILRPAIEEGEAVGEV